MACSACVCDKINVRCGVFNFLFYMLCHSLHLGLFTYHCMHTSFRVWVVVCICKAVWCQACWVKMWGLPHRFVRLFFVWFTIWHYHSFDWYHRIIVSGILLDPTTYGSSYWVYRIIKLKGWDSLVWILKTWDLDQKLL